MRKLQQDGNVCKIFKTIAKTIANVCEISKKNRQYMKNRQLCDFQKNRQIAIQKNRRICGIFKRVAMQMKTL